MPLRKPTAPSRDSHTQHAKRIRVLLDTLHLFSDKKFADETAKQAAANLARWKQGVIERPGPQQVQVINGDWGVVTQELTRMHGETFAVLNMANAYTPGGGCDEGLIAQEENMYRRSDCRLKVPDREIATDRRSYTPAATDLVNGKDGLVAFDETSRYCIKGPEVGNQGDGYARLAQDEIFPFYELRSAAQDLRPRFAGSPDKEFDEDMARRKIAAQLQTLIKYGQRHVVLSAFGCGAFKNPPDVIARLYREELAKRAQHFDVVAFAIYDPGYGPRGNEAIFRKEFERYPVVLGQRHTPAVTPVALPKAPQPSLAKPNSFKKGIIMTLGATLAVGAALYFLAPLWLTVLAVAAIALIGLVISTAYYNQAAKKTIDYVNPHMPPYAPKGARSSMTCEIEPSIEPDINPSPAASPGRARLR